jgi:hypothetical protein
VIGICNEVFSDILESKIKELGVAETKNCTIARLKRHGTEKKFYLFALAFISSQSSCPSPFSPSSLLSSSFPTPLPLPLLLSFPPRPPSTHLDPVEDNFNVSLQSTENETFGPFELVICADGVDSFSR